MHTSCLELLRAKPNQFLDLLRFNRLASPGIIPNLLRGELFGELAQLRLFPVFAPEAREKAWHYRKRAVERSSGQGQRRVRCIRQWEIRSEK